MCPQTCRLWVLTQRVHYNTYLIHSSYTLQCPGFAESPPCSSVFRQLLGLFPRDVLFCREFYIVIPCSAWLSSWVLSFLVPLFLLPKPVWSVFLYPFYLSVQTISSTLAWWRGCLLSAPCSREPSWTAPAHVSFTGRVEYSLPNTPPFSSGLGTSIGGAVHYNKWAKCPPRESMQASTRLIVDCSIHSKMPGLLQIVWQASTLWW
jgi:hypothetical protein